MKVLVYAPLAVLGHHFETDLEIVQKHLEAGDEVTIVTCGADLRPLQFMACQGFFRCAHCTSRCKQGLELLTQKARLREISLKGLAPHDLQLRDEDINSVEKLKQVWFHEVDIGAAHVSSLISDLRDATPDVSHRTAQSREILNFLAGLTVRLEEILDEAKPELVYFFNGRFTLYRPLMRLCEQRGLRFFIHERGASNKLYSLTLNNMPHDLATKEREILSYWQDPAVDVEKKREFSSNWYKRRAAGQATSWVSFTTNQDLSLLPDGWRRDQHNVSIFVSSEDEFACVPGWELEIFTTQIEAVKYILAQFANRPEYKFYLRMHPNMRGLRNADIENIKNLGRDYSNAFVILPESEVSTYNLLKASHKVVSFGSTTGVEAAFMGTPSILIGKAFFMNLGSLWRPRSREEVVEQIGNRDLAPLPIEGALQYAYWAASVGEPFRHYESLSLTAGRFHNVIIRGNPVFMYLNYFFVLLLDLSKILKGEYGFWHLLAKVKAKMVALTPRQNQR